MDYPILGYRGVNIPICIVWLMVYFAIHSTFIFAPIVMIFVAIGAGIIMYCYIPHFKHEPENKVESEIPYESD